ncbi:MAG TPA: ABC transporter substrate-binding protein [Geminicoccaceae bacterium]|nr:ABC transporter substrate-binding protein [Geminicoccaceae bacterium]
MKRLATVLTAAAALAVLATSAQAQDMRKVKIGTEGAYPPFNSIDPSGELVGFDVDIAKALCDAAKFECEFVVQDWDGIIPGLIAKKYDAIIASMSITDKRREVVDFTDKYYNTPAKFIAAKGAGFDISPEGLAGKAVGVQRATIHEDFLRGEFPEVEVRAYATQDEANADLVSGRVDLVMADSVALLEGFLKTDAGADFEFVGPDYNEPKYHGEGAGIAIRKGEDDLLLLFNEAIDQIRADGTYQAINEKYFEFDVYGPTS